MESEVPPPPPVIPAEADADAEEDVPSDFFDEFNKEEFLDGLSVIDSWDEPGGKRRVPRIDADAVESVRDLRELIQDKEDVGTLGRRSDSRSRSRLDDFIKPGSRRDPSKTNEAIKRDKEVKVKEYLAKHLESTDDLRPPGTELDDFFDAKPKEPELRQPKAEKTLTEELYELQKSPSKDNKTKSRRSPRRSPVRSRLSPRRSPHGRKSPRRGLHDRSPLPILRRQSPDRGMRPKRYPISPDRPRPGRFESRRRSPGHSRRHSRSPQRRRSRTRSPQRRRSRTRSPQRRRSRTRSPLHRSRRSPLDSARHRSPLDPGRRRSRSRDRHSSYDYSRESMPHGFGGPFQCGPGPFGPPMDFPGPMMGPGPMPGPGQMPGPGMLGPGPGMLGPGPGMLGPMPGYPGPPGPGQFPGPGFPTPAYGGPGPGPYDFRDMPGILGPVPEPVPAPVMNPIPAPGPIPMPGAPSMVPPPQQMMEPRMSQPREPANNFQVSEIKKPYDALAQLVAEGKLSKEDYLKLAPNKGVLDKMHGQSTSMDNLARVNVLNRCSEALAKLGTLRVPNKLLMNTSMPIVEPKVIAPKFCSPLKRQVPIEFSYTSASGAATAQHNKQLLQSIISTIGLNNIVRPKKKAKKNTRDAAVQTTNPYCDVCEIRDAKEFFDASTRIDPEHFTSSQHTQVLEQDLMSSRAMFNPSGSMGDGAPMSIAHMTPAQLVSQLAARAKTLKQSDQQPPSNQYGRPNYDYDDSNYDRGQKYQNNYNNYNRY